MGFIYGTVQHSADHKQKITTRSPLKKEPREATPHRLSNCLLLEPPTLCVSIIWNYTLSYGLASISNMSIQARYQRAKKPSVKLTILEKYLPELSV